MLSINSPIGRIGSIARSVDKPFKRLGVVVIQDLLFYFPARYEDWSKVTNIVDLKHGVETTVRGRIDLIGNRRSWKKKMIITEAIIRDDTGVMKVGWFYQPYLSRVLKSGDEIYCAGTFRADGEWQMVSPAFERVKKDGTTLHTARIIPVYPSTESLSQKQIRFLMGKALACASQIPEWLPEETVEQYDFPPLSAALSEIHFPADEISLESARKRFKFEELFLLQLYSGMIKQDMKRRDAHKVYFGEELTKRFVGSLPFSLTQDQRKVAWEILQDLAREYPMNRLLQGEVGSGKTIVAAIAALNVARSGAQTAILAPTEILAKQHYETLKKLLAPFSVSVGIFTRSYCATDGEVGKAELLYKVSHGDIAVLVGTHTIIQENVLFKKLAFAVIDEQHRFGVEQRKSLRDKSNRSAMPHLLSMSATPIPRTLALAFFGDLDISEIRELPHGRQAIKTEIRTERERALVYGRMEAEIKADHRVYVVCPLIDPSDVLGVKSVTKEQETLKKQFANYGVGILHGKLKPEEKESTMQKFRSGEFAILVTTTVVEVGVDVPQATLMVIEAGERFGLSQLHQLRGRVGRGSSPGSCIIIADEASEHSLQRLNAFVDCQNGFELAERDLELRGPGEIWGTDQTGFPEFKIATINDREILAQARNAAQKVLEKGIDNFPETKKRLSAFIAHLRGG